MQLGGGTQTHNKTTMVSALIWYEIIELDDKNNKL